MRTESSAFATESLRAMAQIGAVPTSLSENAFALRGEKRGTTKSSSLRS